MRLYRFLSMGEMKILENRMYMQKLREVSG